MLISLPDTAATLSYTVSLHDALPISAAAGPGRAGAGILRGDGLDTHLDAHDAADGVGDVLGGGRSEEHTSELQSRGHLVCRLLHEKKKNGTTHAGIQTLEACDYKHAV